MGMGSITHRETSAVTETTPFINSDEVKNKAEINGKTFSMFESQNSYINEIKHRYIDFVNDNATALVKRIIDRVVRICKSIIPSDLFKSCFPSSANDVEAANINRPADVPKFTSGELIEKLTNFLTEGYKKYAVKGQDTSVKEPLVFDNNELGNKIFSQLKEIDKALQFEAKDVPDYLKEVMIDGLIEESTKALPYYKKANFSDYLRNNSGGRLFCTNNVHKKELQTLRKMQNFIEEQLIKSGE